MTWTQPLCRPCWDTDHHDQPNLRPLDERALERCCMCGTWNMSGIYALYRPAAVPYPTEDPT